MDNRYVLVLASLNPDGSDLSGNVFPQSGHVEANQFKLDKDIRYGLYGTLGGKSENSCWINTDPKAQWRVIRTEKSDQIIALDEDNNFVKYRQGMVVHSGTQSQCCEYICTNCDETATCDRTQCKVMSMKILKSGTDEHVLCKGFASTAKTISACCHAVNAGEMGNAHTSEFSSHAVTLAPKGNATALGEESFAMALGPDSQANAPGKGGKAVVTNPGSLALSGRRGIAIGACEGCTALVKENGIIALLFNDGKRLRLKVGYAGEDVQANQVYRLSEKGEFEILPSGG